MATTIVQTQTRKRGVMGRLIKWTFILFNVAMALWMFSYWGNVGDMGQRAVSDAERAGLALGAVAGTSFIVFFWAAGSIVLGILTLLTRGKVVVIETRDG